jgi:TPR repeat protein
MRDLAHSLKLYVKLAQQGNTDGKIMAGLMYFRGEGTVRDVKIAKHYFDQSSKDEVSEYMLLAM